MHSNVEASGMVPSESSHQHGPPLLRRVRCLRSPTSSLVCGPPTPSPLSIAASVAPRGAIYHLLLVGMSRVSQVPGASSFQRAAFPNPVRCADLSPPSTWSALLPSGTNTPSAPERTQFRG